MKKIFALIVAVASVAAVVTSCSNKQFNDLYPDPSKTSVATCDKLFTGTMIAGNQNTFNSYWRMYTWDNYFGKLAQTIGFSNNSGSVYYINDGYANDRWNNFYNILRNFRVLQDVYDKEDDAAKAEDKIFVDLAEIFMLDHATRLVDIWGDIPFTEACYLGITYDVASSYATYDTGEEVYKVALNRLDAIYTDLSSLQNSISSTVQAKLTKQDFLNGGNIDKWMRYCNTLMLRLGVHVAAQGPLTAEGKAAVAKAAGRLLVTDLDNCIEAASDLDGFRYNENFRDGFKDINNTASQEMIDAMQIDGIEDPRLPVIYVPTKTAYAGGEDPDDKAYAIGEYFGRSTTETDNQQNVRSGSNHNTEETRYYARLNGKTFTYNNLMVSPVISAAEAWFLLAEAYQQDYASGNAEAAFKKGMEMSIKAYYKSNMEAVFSNPSIATTQADDFQAKEMPSDSDIAAYSDVVWNHYSDKLEGIMTQKWVHFGILQATQAWTDIRRTGFPDLYYPKDGADNNGYPTVTQRVKYPNSEATNNAANYKTAAAGCDNDSAYSVIFWAKEVK